MADLIWVGNTLLPREFVFGFMLLVPLVLIIFFVALTRDW